MTKKIIRLTPDQMAYHDRGKMKWQGLILSDHKEAIQKRNQDQVKESVLPKDNLSLKDIGSRLSLAYQTNHPILIQTNTLVSSVLFQEYYCLVTGFYEDKIYFTLKNRKTIQLSLENIRYLELIDPTIWQNLN